MDKLSNMAAEQISKYSYGDMPWKVTENLKPIDYRFIFYRDPEYCVRIYND